MRGLLLSFCVLVCLSSNAFAYESRLGLDYRALSPYDVVVPSLNGEPAGADRQAGQVFLDITSGTTGTFKAIGKDGSVVTLSSGTGNPVTTGGTERIERAKILNNGACSVSSGPSSGWINSVTRTTQGVCQITFTSGVFSAAPSCICTSDSTSQYNCSNYAAPTTSGVTNATISGMSNQDSDYDLICMGPN